MRESGGARLRDGLPTDITLRPLPFLAAACLFAQDAPDFSKLTARPSADWVRDAVMYEAYPRAFSAKGDFNGVTAKLDELQRLGVTVLWIRPVHPVGQVRKKGTFGSLYSVQDYYAIDPAYGTAADLKRLVSEAHRRGLHVILDVVLNHTAWDSVLIRHPSFSRHGPDGKIIPPVPEWTTARWRRAGRRGART